MNRPISALINTQALSENLKKVRQYAPNSKIWSVIKANGYGHGINSVFQGLHKTDGFALIDINDAITLRNMGWNKPILLLEGFFNYYELKEVDHYKLTTVIHNNWQLNAIKKFNFKNKLNIYIKINCGMNRLGFNYRKVVKIYKELKLTKVASEIKIMTHISHSVKENLNKQRQKLKLIQNYFKKENFCFSNSLYILEYPNTYKNWVRPGIVLYGASPNGISDYVIEKGFTPVMTLQSRIIAVRTVNSNNYLGYNKIKLNKKKKLE